MSAHVAVAEITFKSGATFHFGEGDVIVIVGPNNVGKSRLLGDIYASMQQGVTGPIIQNLRLKKTGTVEDLRDLLRERTMVSFQPGQPNNALYSALNFSTYDSNLPNFWSNPDTLSQLTGAFCALANTESRLRITDPPETYRF